VSLTRRTLLDASAALALAGLAGCLGRSGGLDSTDQPSTDGDQTSTATDTPEPCRPTTPPASIDAAAAPKSYPTRPAEFTSETVASFVEAYERVFRYNQQLSEHPSKIGQTNDLSVYVRETSVTPRESGFEVQVSGELIFGITDSDETPATPTPTPLPMGHDPFETTFLVTERSLTRAGIVVECWD
jgi:hypothetical protein